MQPTNETTTADALGSYYKELLENGLPVHLADQLVLSAARPLHEGLGLVVNVKRS